MTNPYQFHTRGTFIMNSNPTHLALSNQGDYLIARGQEGELAYYNWKRELLWSGQGAKNPAKVIVSSDRQRAAVHQDSVIHAFDAQGQAIWGYSTDWPVLDLFMNGAQPIIAAARGREVVNLNLEGAPVWRFSTPTTVRSLAISLTGQNLVVGLDKNLICLDAQGQPRWQFPMNETAALLSFGRDRIVVADRSGAIYCLNDQGELLAVYENNEGQIQALAISGSGGYVAVAFNDAIRQMQLLRSGALVITPMLPERPGIAQDLQAFKPGEIRDLHLSPASDSILAETPATLFCYQLDGVLVWRCQKINPDIYIKPLAKSVIFGRVQNGQGKQIVLIRQNNVIARLSISQSGTFRFQGLAKGVYSVQMADDTNVRQDNISVDGTNSREINLTPIIIQPPPNPVELFMEKLQSEFIEFTQFRGALKAQAAQTRTRVPLVGEILDVYFDGNGYLFVTKDTDETLRRARRLAQKTNIYIVAYDASDQFLQDVKQTKGVELYRLDDMVKTGGMFAGKSEFETFMKMVHHKEFRRV